MDVALPRRALAWPKLGLLGVVLVFGVWAAWGWVKGYQPRAVSVERSSLWIGRVQRGEMLREVQARGVLIAKDVYWVTATCAGRVESLNAVAGEHVLANATLAELSNPELVLQSLEAQRTVAAAQSQGFALKEAALETRLAEQSRTLDLTGALRMAEASYSATAQLVNTGAVTPIEHERALAERDSLSQRLAAAEAVSEELARTAARKLEAVRLEQRRLLEIAKFRQQRLGDLAVRSPVAGIIAEVRVELGQWLSPGTTLAKVVNPTSLKARLFVPEAQAKDLKDGQVAHIEVGEHMLQAVLCWIAPAVESGTVAVDLALQGPLPVGARPDLAIVGHIELERLSDVLFVERPTGIGADSNASLFKLESEQRAIRQAIRFGRVSALTIEVKSGLQPGDELILSDISKWDQLQQLQLREEPQ